MQNINSNTHAQNKHTLNTHLNRNNIYTGYLYKTNETHTCIHKSNTQFSDLLYFNIDPAKSEDKTYKYKTISRFF